MPISQMRYASFDVSTEAEKASQNLHAYERTLVYEVQHCTQ